MTNEFKCTICTRIITQTEAQAYELCERCFETKLEDAYEASVDAFNDRVFDERPVHGVYRTEESIEAEETASFFADMMASRTPEQPCPACNSIGAHDDECPAIFA